jgi:hypothetical protein
LVPDRVCVANNQYNSNNDNSYNNHFPDDDNQQQQVEQQDHGEDKALSPPPPRQQLPVSQRRSLNLEGNTAAADVSAAASAAGCWRKRPAKKDGEQVEFMLQVKGKYTNF